jgi:acyl-CoA thioesterase-1
MATLRSYSATFEQSALANAAVARWRFNESAGSATATDSVDSLDGVYESGAAPGAAGSIGDGAAQFNGSGFVLVETLSGTITVSAFGDSEIEGVYPNGPAPLDRFSPDLEAALDARGLDATVINRGIGGNTTAQGLARVDDVTGDDPDVVILELGTNDAIQKIDPDTVGDHLRSIIHELQTGGVDQILLTGTFGFYPERNGGSGYNTQPERAAFEAKFAEIAGDTPGVVLLNDVDGSDKFLGGKRIPGTPDTISGGVLDSNDTSLSAGDGLHPNAPGVDSIVERVTPQTIAPARQRQLRVLVYCRFGLRRSRPGGQELGRPGNRWPVRDLDQRGRRGVLCVGRRGHGSHRQKRRRSHRRGSADPSGRELRR